MSYWFDLLTQNFDFLLVFKEIVIEQTAGWGFVLLYIGLLMYSYIKSRTPYVPLVLSIVFIPFVTSLLPVETQKYAYVLTVLAIATLLAKIIYDLKN